MRALDAVRLTGITKRFGRKTAVDALDLTVPEGAIYGFIGPNGSGKTTTIRMLLHIILPDAGEVEVLGETETRGATDSIGYLPEERGLYRKMTVMRQLLYFAHLKGLTGRPAREAASGWLERFDLAEWGPRKIEALSKGMAQKVQFIASVIHRPRLLILDEPFTGLDPVNLEVLRAAILDLRREGATIIFSTHDMAMAETLCDFVFMIHEGRKVLDGTMDAIQAEHGADEVKVLTDGGRAALEGRPCVAEILDQGRYQRVRLAGDPQELLRELSAATRVRHFEVCRPSLHEIFLRIAGSGASASEEESRG